MSRAGLYPMMRILMKTLIISVVTICLLSSGASGIFCQEVNSFAIRDCRIFDGEKIIYGSLLVQKGMISSVGLNIEVPDTIFSLEGSGKTVLPGLIDAHVHIFTEFQLEQALIFGVTHVIDMFMDPVLMGRIKSRLADPAVHNLAGLTSPGILATAPNGHGTQFGLDIPTVSAPDQAQSFVDARLAEGSDFIKIICEDGDENHRYNSLDFDIIAALISAAHKRNKMAVVHILQLHDARKVIEAGADGLAHLYADGGFDPDFGRIAAEHHIFVIPTLSVLQSICGVGDIQHLIQDPYLKPYMTPVDVMMLERTFPYTTGAGAYADAEKALRQLRANHVPILAGTDAPNPGTTYGPSLHRELLLLVEAGLTPVEALMAATSIPAETFKLANPGRIRPGVPADLLMVEGDPTRDIRNTRRIVAVWKNGWLVDRDL